MKIGTKAMLLISSVTLLVFSAAIGYITLKSNKLALKDAMVLSDTYANQYANLVMSNINVDMNTARTISETFKGYKGIPYDYRTDIYNDVLRNITIENSNFLSVWVNWELSALDSNYSKPYGRARFTVYRDINNSILYYTDTLNRDGDDINGAYYKMKVSKLETVMEPYYFTYKGTNEQILETSVCAPILDNGKFVGLAGIDLGLNRFDDMVSKISPFKGSNAFLVSNEGIIITHPEKEFVGKTIHDLMPELDDLEKISEKIKAGRNFSFKTKNERYISFASFTIGITETPWSLAIDVPISIILEKASRHIRVSIVVGIIGLILLSIFIYVVTLQISIPLVRTSELVRKLANGNIDDSHKLKIKSGDEIEDIANSVNTLIDGLNSTAHFAVEIGKGNLNAEFQLLSEKDVLGNSLLEMRKSLIHSREEEEARKVEDEKQNWITKGMNKFSEILRQNNDNIKELSFQIMSNLIQYIDANQGALFVKSTAENEKEDVFFELTSAIAYGRDRLMEKKIILGDGLVGRCAFEQLTIYMINVPEDYVNISSGLGQSKPKSILIVPLKLNEEVYGVIELISFSEFEKYQIEFVEQLGTSIASTISTVKVNEKTAKLLEQSQKQAEELAAQEEEMRQNLEELQATQEEASRRENEMGGILKALNENLLVMEIDMEGNIMTANDSFCQLIGMSVEQLVGRKQLDLPFLSEKEIRKYSDLWVYFKDGISKREVTSFTINNQEMWLSETFTPILDFDGKPYKVLNMAINITKSKMAELKFARLISENKEKSEKLNLNSKELENLFNINKDLEEKSKELEKRHTEKISTLQDSFEKQIRQNTEELKKKNKIEIEKLKKK